MVWKLLDRLLALWGNRNGPTKRRWGAQKRFFPLFPPGVGLLRNGRSHLLPGIYLVGAVNLLILNLSLLNLQVRGQTIAIPTVPGGGTSVGSSATASAPQKATASASPPAYAVAQGSPGWNQPSSSVPGGSVGSSVGVPGGGSASSGVYTGQPSGPGTAPSGSIHGPTTPGTSPGGPPSGSLGAAPGGQSPISSGPPGYSGAPGGIIPPGGGAGSLGGGAVSGPPSTFAPPLGSSPTPNYGGTSPYAPSPYAGSGGTYAPPTYAPPSGGPPGYSGPVPSVPPSSASGAILGPTISPPPPQWDPYASPGAQIAPTDPLQPLLGNFSGQSLPKIGQRLLDHWQFEYLWMPGNASKELGIHHWELSGTFAFPFLWNTQSPLLVTPGFGMWFWNGPDSPHDMPTRTYDAFLEGAWNPQVNQWLGGELSFRIGVYSDFKKVTFEALRYQGKGMAVLTLNQAFQCKFGVWYLDRNRVKLLPAGGVIWTPNSDVRFEILFPNPRLTQRLTTWGTTEWWWYVRGEYGGGAWEFTRDPASVGGNLVDHVDYNDLEAALGLEFKALSGLSGHIEAGIAFDRELFYTSRNPDAFFRPNPAFLLRAGITY